MPDLVYLSLWLEGFEEQNMLGSWRQALEEFPATPQAAGVRSLAIYPLDWSETPTFDQTFWEGILPAEAQQLASEYLHPDYAYEARMNWDLWQPKAQELSGGWERRRQEVAIICLGPEFDRQDREDSGHLEIVFGPESQFLPTEGWALTREQRERLMSGPEMRENVGLLVHYARLLENKLPVARRRLWCESGENLAEQILSSWKMEP